MQLHDHSGSAPALAAHGQNGKLLRMQNHAPLHARLKYGEIARKWYKKTGIQGAGFGQVCRGYWPRNAPITLLRYMLATIIRKIVVHGFS